MAATDGTPPPTTTRSDYESLIEMRMNEARALLDAGYWNGAYYLAGYAVECALKVRIVARLTAAEYFPTRKEVDDFYQHDLEKLLTRAELKDEILKDPTVNASWSVVRLWREFKRYDPTPNESDARKLIAAIEEILPWIKARCPTA